jgi:three-Cys-motif partner protein
MSAKEEQYSLGDDGLVVENVGPWAKHKLKLLTDYIQASGGARNKWRHNGAALVDVFCGPGRLRIRTTGEFIDGSPVAAFKQGRKSLAEFTTIEISDANPELLSAAEQRLRKLAAPVVATPGPAVSALRSIVQKLQQSGLHFAFLDPHNLGALSFTLFELLATLKQVDVIVHVSLADLRRNADRYSSEAYDQFDSFAPGWRKEISSDMSQKRLRAAIIEYWSSKVARLGLPRARHCELIRGPDNQQLYWLILLARHDLARTLWNKISSAARSPTLFD